MTLRWTALLALLALGCSETAAPLSAYSFGGQWIPPEILQEQQIKDREPGLGDALSVLDPVPVANASEPSGYGGRGMSLRPLPTVFHYAYRAEAQATGAAGGFANLVRFLVEGTGATSGPGPQWRGVEVAQDAGWGGGACATDRALFPNPADVDSCGAWAPAVNDWVVLRSGIGMYGTQYELYLELHSTTVIAYIMMPYDNYATAPGAFVSPPAFPATSVCAGAATLCTNFTVVNGAYRMSAIADTTMLQLLSDNAGTRYWLYIGELNGAKSDGTPTDDRPFVIWDLPTTYAAGTGASPMNRIAADDDATALVAGYLSGAFNVFRDVANNGDNSYLTRAVSFGAFVSFQDAGRQNLAGFARGLDVYGITAGQLIQTTDRCFVGISSSAILPGFLIKWDCTTVYTGATVVNISHKGAPNIPRDWVYGGNY